MNRIKQDTVRVILGEIARESSGIEVKARATAIEYATEANMAEPGRSMFVEHYVSGTLSAHAHAVDRRLRDVVDRYLTPSDARRRRSR